ncbi:MAG: amidase [Rhizobiales bacterium]|nr:amidase [Hyphomicrobiales bacterium]
MSKFTDYDKYDGLGLAALVKSGDVTPTELLDTAIERTEAVNPKINAVVLKHYDEARAQIEKGLPDGPYRGVPFLIKDLNMALKGTITTSGSKFFATQKFDHNNTLTDRYLEAGLVIFGKTNSPEFGLTVTTEPVLHGPSRNPWNLEHSTGGSSGGAAAAVAAGIIPVANASDGGGSIRVPSAACGLFGMKPTRGRTPAGPDRGEGWAGMSISHVVSRTVRDSAAMLDATAGAAIGDPYAAPHQARPYLEELAARPTSLRIAFTTKRPDGSLCHPEVVKTVEATAKLCEELGHKVEEAALKTDPTEMSRAQAALIASNTRAAVRERELELGREATPEDLEHITWLVSESGKTITGPDYVAGTHFIHQLGRRFGDFMQKYDVLLGPTLATPPIKLGWLDMMTDDVGTYFNRMSEYLPAIGMFNMTGQPSMSMPLHMSSDGLPLGMMFTGRFGDEATLYRLAGQLEEALPWIGRYPKL